MNHELMSEKTKAVGVSPEVCECAEQGNTCSELFDFNGHLRLWFSAVCVLACAIACIACISRALAALHVNVRVTFMNL